ncbi:zinc metallopeptidase [Cytophagaceae bacterium DM2B3-1]|uniref:Zinc metallopeptidase n=2 Tax=Xanthocytophaga TaxID=3078918 RepID=A0ABT7CII8_9BACT|nr:MULTISPECIES: zinc metallopeptidase [Xanthocytophaga]MDJ1493558.1 zinc metallopeptidase [Xanthocytophaga flavus]MDJ1506203.1 zinc metallopeptidase [Xanthocytophaga agilis]
MIFLISIVTMLVSMFVSWQLKSKFAQYSQIPLAGGMSGAEAAAKMLRDNNIFDVRITAVEGQLTDHYNPADKTVNLSQDVYYGRSAAAVAVASHECGHAVQHATSYGPLQMRSALVPVVSICGNVLQVLNMLILFGVGYSIFQGHGAMGNILLLVLIGANAGLALFSTITLPVEFDASRRALVWMENSGVVTQREHDMAKDALKWAAMTYVVAAIGALAQLAYWIFVFMGRRDD